MTEQSKIEKESIEIGQPAEPSAVTFVEVAAPSPSREKQRTMPWASHKWYGPSVIVSALITLLVVAFGVGEEGIKAVTALRAFHASFSLSLPKAKTNRIEAIDTPYDIYSRAGHQAASAKLRKEFFKKALNEAEKENGRYSYLKSCALADLYSVSIVEEDWEEVERYAQLIQENQLALNGPRDPVLADAYCMLASACFKKKQLQRGSKFVAKAVAISKRACDPGSILFEKIMIMDANKGKYPFTFYPSLHYRHREPESSWRDLPSAHFQQLAIVAGISADTGDLSKAESSFKHAIEIGKMNEKNGCEIQCTASIMNDYACLLRRAGKLAEAKLLEAEVDRIRIQHYGSLPPLD